MHYCLNCRKWNTDWPQRCRYCGAGLEGRLCPSGHINPPDRSIAFCGDCGKPLESKWGAGFSFKPYLLGVGILMATGFLCGAVAGIGQPEAPFATAIVVLVMLVLAFRFAFRIMPPWVSKLVLDITSLLLRLMFGTGIKGRK